MGDTAEDNRRIDLAYAPDLRIGQVVARPGLRQLIRDDGASEVLEPRMMQVLLALARAQGGIVTRDELTHCCWEDRIVGEDAINRVISRLRRVSEGIGAGSFRIETITKVGYRLEMTQATLRTHARRRHDDGHRTTSRRRASPAAALATRRSVIAGGMAGLAALGGGAVWWRSRSAAIAPPERAALLDQALLALQQDTREGQDQAIGLLRHLVSQAPGYVDGWGVLATAYAFSAHWRTAAQAETLRARARAAVDRCDALAPDNAYAIVARAIAVPLRENLRGRELALRHALQLLPDSALVPFMLGMMLCCVDRMNEAAALMERARLLGGPTPGIYFAEIEALWHANRLEEADRLIEEASALYPSHFAIWFARVYVLMYTGRAAKALALLTDTDDLPTGIPHDEFASGAMVAHALVTRDPAEIDRVIAHWLKRAKIGSGFAENTIQYASALGRIDTAFAVADAYFFGRGFVVPELRFSREQGSYAPMRERTPHFLFNAATASMRADPRFARLTGQLGLDRYWQEAGVVPDYLRG